MYLLLFSGIISDVQWFASPAHWSGKGYSVLFERISAVIGESDTYPWSKATSFRFFLLSAVSTPCTAFPAPFIDTKKVRKIATTFL